MRRKFLPLLLLLLASAVLSANIRYAAAQHRTDFIIDPCSSCKIAISNGSFHAAYLSGSNASLENGQYYIAPVLSSGYTFSHWNSTSGITIQNKTAYLTNITLSGIGPSSLTLTLNAPASTIQPIPILLLALTTASLPVLLRRSRKPSGLA